MMSFIKLFLLLLHKKQKDNSVNDVIHKTIFTFITQMRFREIVKGETEKLKKKIQ